VLETARLVDGLGQDLIGVQDHPYPSPPRCANAWPSDDPPRFPRHRQPREGRIDDLHRRRTQRAGRDLTRSHG
jgi:hypothetical protein